MQSSLILSGDPLTNDKYLFFESLQITDERITLALKSNRLSKAMAS